MPFQKLRHPDIHHYVSESSTVCAHKKWIQRKLITTKPTKLEAAHWTKPALQKPTQLNKFTLQNQSTKEGGNMTNTFKDFCPTATQHFSRGYSLYSIIFLSTLSYSPLVYHFPFITSPYSPTTLSSFSNQPEYIICIFSPPRSPMVRVRLGSSDICSQIAFSYLKRK